MKYKLVIKEHEDLGTNGIVILNSSRDWFEPALGIGIAHDILEHPLRPHTCPYIDELMALGGLIYIRWLNGAMANKFRSFKAEDLTADLYELARSYEGPVFVSTHSGSKTVQDENVRDLIEECLEALPSFFYENEDEHLVWNKENVRSYLIKGYQLAMRRFYTLDSYLIAHNLFPSIEKQCDLWLKSGEVGYTAELNLNLSQYRSNLIDTTWD